MKVREYAGAARIVRAFAGMAPDAGSPNELHLYSPLMAPLKSKPQAGQGAAARQLLTYPYESRAVHITRRKKTLKIDEAVATDLQEKFILKLGEVSLSHALNTSNVVIGVNAELRICFVNPAWEYQAKGQGREAVSGDSLLGGELVSMMAGPVQGYYARALKRALYTLEPWHHRYLCPSPVAMEEWKLSAYPLQDRSGLLLYHALVVQRPSARAYAAVDERYLDLEGGLTICCHCRRTRRAMSEDLWDYVPAYLGPDAPHEAEQILCPACHDFYPGINDESDTEEEAPITERGA